MGDEDKDSKPRSGVDSESTVSGVAPSRIEEHRDVAMGTSNSVPAPANLDKVAGAFALSGIVRDAGGIPISGATVRVLAFPGQKRLGETKTDGDGRYSFKSLATIQSLRSSGQSGGPLSDILRGARQRLVTREEEEEARPKPPAETSTESDSTPQVDWGGSRPMPQVAFSEPNRYAIYVSLVGYQSERRFVHPMGRGEATQDFSLFEGVPIEGAVICTARPIEGADVKLVARIGSTNESKQAAWHMGNPTHQTTTDGLGLFALRGLSSGRYVIRISAPGIVDEECIVESGHAPQEIQVREAGSIAVTCKELSLGRPIHRARVVLQRDDRQVSFTDSDAFGKCRFERLPPGEYQVIVKRESLALATGGL